MTYDTAGDQPIYPEGLRLLESVLKKLCKEAEIQLISYNAEQIAAELIKLFQSGMKDETVLLVIMRARLRKRPVLAVG
ncbi:MULTISPECIES: hypothetical protein [unclassified Mesorhizobium]|uniref:hypothetical protein n=1 Tax=unclassified Mesorhizobium TaxID=325217 RepID=UPI000FCB4248|nr:MULTISPECIES: hypothetical protein [unclassified Mesorhizobium]AZV17636.1 hypothetical protein EJ079_00145 [Mesorhizobium sp. M7A.F.Ce.TU.012.03.2.1]RUU89197.1 hypothetical protein EOB59_19765 [Mesorhizobium sp. M7A.F.Ca.MR.176.00.0.0]RVD19336.1 hypothetical protein EN749_01405 [Mesorhizobium sp. M7A.F.Ca.ET.027.02.1.1]RVD66438.1 hypothetical protein EN750_03435 [Mesorhizobium sp. M7A.F.Ca.ET.027.03.2.1]RWB10221.1 MAG: hypothetical protein EOQ37_03505 [Mesorhizobium sp.]